MVVALAGSDQAVRQPPRHSHLRHLSQQQYERLASQEPLTPPAPSPDYYLVRLQELLLEAPSEGGRGQAIQSAHWRQI